MGPIRQQDSTRGPHTEIPAYAVGAYNLQFQQAVHQPGSLREHPTRGVQGLLRQPWQRWKEQIRTVAFPMFLR